ncbi:MAG TPA: hypothetical protein VJ499_11845 [Flavisolibacter sp.]|nr:hypothetical protein [Flavisolibacter sp.]
MKLIYGCILVLVFSACNNSTENATPTGVDHTVNKDTTMVANDSIPNQSSMDSMHGDSSIKTIK